MITKHAYWCSVFRTVSIEYIECLNTIRVFYAATTLHRVITVCLVPRYAEGSLNHASQTNLPTFVDIVKGCYTHGVRKVEGLLHITYNCTVVSVTVLGLLSLDLLPFFESP